MNAFVPVKYFLTASDAGVASTSLHHQDDPIPFLETPQTVRRYLDLLLVLVVISAVAFPQEKVVPAINEVDLWREVGQQPYEFTWTQREQDPHALVDFEDLSGWNLEFYDGAQGELRRSREEQLWGQYVAKIVYSGVRSQSRVVARPPQPVPITGAFDSIDLWGYGNWISDTSRSARAAVSVLIQDARGKEFSIRLNEIQWRAWWLIHRRVPRQTLDQIRLPARFSGIEISNLVNPEPSDFYCDSLAFSTEVLKPLAFKPLPRRNLEPYPDELVGLNTGPGTLPFPVREETILPSNFQKNFKVSVQETAPHQFELRYEGTDSRVIYAYHPQKGDLDDLTVRVNGGPPFKPLDSGGVRFVNTAAGSVAEGELVAADLHKDMVHARFRMGGRLVEYQLRLWQKSLVLDVRCAGGQASELSFGRVSGVSHPRLVTTPYLTYGRQANPRVLMTGEAGSPIFTSIWFDWYRSNASEPYFNARPKVTDDGAEINGGMRYLPKTDGLRNNLYERIFVTTSPNYEETLPTIANPPSLRQTEGQQVLWTVMFPTWYPKDHEQSVHIRSYGIDKVMQHSHASTWRDWNDSFTLRVHAAPQKGGDAMLKWYVQAQNKLGWLQGAYTNYTDYDPINENWNPDNVQRMPDGEWRRAFTRTYALKPAKAVEFDDYYAKRIQQRYGTKMCYTDVHSAVPPWRYCDFDARVPGAGTFAATFYAYGQLLLNDQRVYGPTQSEGTFQWLYAGLESGSYGWVYTNLNLLTAPLNVSFMLRKIHPLECDYGMGMTFYYLSQIDKDWATSPNNCNYLDLFLATTIAYGNMGWLVTEFDPAGSFNVEAMARSYYLMQQLQQQYAFVPPKVIEYADQTGRFLTASQAIGTGENADGRLHVRYENGTEVYVNRSSAHAWTVRDQSGKLVKLPVSGWLAFNPTSHFYEVSAELGGHRLDYVLSHEFEFLDGRGQWTERGTLGATGSVALRRLNDGILEVIDIYGNQHIGVRADVATVMAYDASGNSLGRVEVTSPQPRLV